MGSPIVSPLISLLIRILTIIILMASLIVIATDTIKFSGYNPLGISEITFNDYNTYRYMLAVTIIGMTVIILQSALAIFHVSSGIPSGSMILAHVEFYTDKMISYLLATGAAAGLGLTVDVKEKLDAIHDSFYRGFFDKAGASAALLFIGFLLSAISSVFSSLNLPKDVSTN